MDVIFQRMELDAKQLLPRFLEEVLGQANGVRKLVPRVQDFLNEATELVGKYENRIEEKYDGEAVPPDVRSAVLKFEEHMQKIAWFIDPGHCYPTDSVIAAALMAAMTAEMKALNFVLDF